MSKGIREFAVATFNANLHMRAEGDTAFRKHVLGEMMTHFGISNFSAAGAYNYALKLARETNPDAVAGLGRPEGYTGGNTKANKAKREAAKAQEAPTVVPAEAPVAEVATQDAAVPATNSKRK